MANASVASEIHEPLYVHRDLAPQVPLHGVLRHLRTQLVDLFFRQVLNSGIQLDTDGLTDLSRTVPTDAIDCSQRNDSVLSVGDVDTGDTGHYSISKSHQRDERKPRSLAKLCNMSMNSVSALTLLVLRVFADHSNSAVSADDLAVAANFLY